MFGYSGLITNTEFGVWLIQIWYSVYSKCWAIRLRENGFRRHRLPQTFQQNCNGLRCIICRKGCKLLMFLYSALNLTSVQVFWPIKQSESTMVVFAVFSEDVRKKRWYKCSRNLCYRNSMPSAEGILSTMISEEVWWVWHTSFGRMRVLTRLSFK